MEKTDLHWCPDTGNGYAPTGEQIKVDSPGKASPWCPLFGSLIYPTGEGVVTKNERKRHQEVAAHVKLLIELDPDAFWFIVIDNAPAHTTQMLEALLSPYRNQIELVFLPTYSPHLNRIERLWRLMRGQMTKNQFYDSLKALLKAVVDWLKKLPFSKFCSLMGIDESALGFSPPIA